LHLLLEEPDSSILARIVSYGVLQTIILAIVGFILQTLPSLQDSVAFDVIEIGSTVILTLEYLLRFLACNAFGDQTRLAFVRAPMNILDVMAILPFYVERSLESLELKPFRVLRSARLIRIFRIFKLSKYSVGMNLMVESLVNSVRPLSVLAFFLCIGVLLFSSLLYYTERMSCPDIGAEELAAYRTECEDSTSGWTRNGDLCCTEHKASMGFPSIAETFWWSIVTMTTVGYGDMVPRTVLGRLVAGAAMLSGIILISLPVAIVGAKFQTAYEEFELDREEMIMLEKEAEEESRAMRPPGMKQRPSWGGIRMVMKIASNRDRESAAKRAVRERGAFSSETTPPVGAQTDAGAGNPRSSGGLRHSEPTFSVRSSLGTGSKTPAGPKVPSIEAMHAFVAQLQQLETNSSMSPAAQEQVQLVLELVGHVQRAERQLAILREKDAVLDQRIRNEFAAIVRRYDTCFTREMSMR